MRPSLPTCTTRCGWAAVPNPAGRAIGPPEPRSWSYWSSPVLLAGLKNERGDRLPLLFTCSRTTDSAKVDGGASPAVGAGETPLPVATTIRPGPSETSPPPGCQIPASAEEEPASVDHIVVCCPVDADTPTM